METVGDLLATEGPADAPTLRAGDRAYDRGRFRETVYKTGNYLRQCGVHEGTSVAIVDGPYPEAVVALLGTALHGAQARFVPDPGAAAPAPIEDAVLLGPTDALDAFDVAPGGDRIAVDDPPSDPTWAYFPREIWSENGFFPDVPIDPTRPLLEGWPQREAIDAAESTAEALDAVDVVAIRGPLTDPRVAIGGILAPLGAGATILVPVDDEAGTVAVVGEGDPDVPEGRLLAVD